MRSPKTRLTESVGDFCQADDTSIVIPTKAKPHGGIRSPFRSAVRENGSLHALRLVGMTRSNSAFRIHHLESSNHRVTIPQFSIPDPALPKGQAGPLIWLRRFLGASGHDVPPTVLLRHKSRERKMITNHPDAQKERLPQAFLRASNTIPNILAYYSTSSHVCQPPFVRNLTHLKIHGKRKTKKPFCPPSPREPRDGHSSSDSISILFSYSYSF